MNLPILSVLQQTIMNLFIDFLKLVLKMFLFKSLKVVRIKNLNRIVLAYLNSDSLRNKFDLPAGQIKEKFDILVISETKLDGSFPAVHF